MLAAVFIALAMVQVRTQKIDEIALAFITLALATLLLPVIRSHVRAIELPSGVKVEVLEMKVRHQEAKRRNASFWTRRPVAREVGAVLDLVPVC